jgi:putative Mg2+ transporter-C (MgtC) family protein
MERLISFESAPLTSLAHIAVAMLLAGVIGLEREQAHKPAGLRTHMLVAGAAALLVILGDLVIHRYNRPEFIPGIRADPLRILSAVITGVSFLGAGTILRRVQTDKVEGLTTAASLLMVAAIGATVALGEPGLAVGVTVLVFGILHLVARVEGHVGAHDAKGRR